MAIPMLEFRAEPHPYPDQPGAASELWGRLRGAVGDEELFRVHWDLAEFAEWFTAHLRHFLHDRLTDVAGPDQLLAGASLAGNLRHLSDRLSEDGPDDVLDAVYAYRERHVLRFGLRGAVVPPVVLGMNDEVGELSLSDERAWAYTFPMPVFLADTALQLRELVLSWRARTPAATERADRLLSALERG